MAASFNLLSITSLDFKAVPLSLRPSCVTLKKWPRELQGREAGKRRDYRLIKFDLSRPSDFSVQTFNLITRFQ